MKVLISSFIILALTWPVMANDDEIVEFLDFFENMEIVEDDNFKKLTDDKNELDDEEEINSSNKENNNV